MQFRVVRHGVVDSTNERAFASIAEGAAKHGDVHVADEQTAGRGRRGRAWISAAGEGLYASLVWMPPAVEARALPPAAFTVLAGLAVLDAVEALGLRNARLKWPNDVLVDAAKLCGILVESRGLDATRPHFVIGIGINVGQASFPDELLAARPVTSLRLSGVTTTRDDVLSRLMGALGERLTQAQDDLTKLTRDYLARAHLAARPVRLSKPSEELVGQLREFDLSTGRILLDTADGEREARLEHLTACISVTGAPGVNPADKPQG